MNRPENCLPAELYYNKEEAKKYINCSRIMKIQAELTERCIELLNLPPNQPAFLLDIGSGSGLSGEILNDLGHMFIGIDISRDMLNVAKERDQSRGACLARYGVGFAFRSGVFDGAISVSAL